MIELVSFVGEKVVIQFRNRDVWLTVHADGDDPAVAATVDSKGQVSMIPAPFLIGKVLDKGEESFAVQIQDENGKRLDVYVNPDAILTVTMVTEGRILSSS